LDSKWATKMTEPDKDLPKIIASIGWMIPSLTIKTGWAYLRMKKKAQKSSKEIRRVMVNNGVPPEVARELASDFGEELSLTKMMRMATRGRF
jgi:hypothetical protein